MDIIALGLCHAPRGGSGIDFGDLAAQVADQVEEVGGLFDELPATPVQLAPPPSARHDAVPVSADEGNGFALQNLPGEPNRIAVAKAVGYAAQDIRLAHGGCDPLGHGPVESYGFFDEEVDAAARGRFFDAVVRVRRQAHVDGLGLDLVEHDLVVGECLAAKTLRSGLGSVFLKVAMARNLHIGHGVEVPAMDFVNSAASNTGHLDHDTFPSPGRRRHACGKAVPSGL